MVRIRLPLPLLVIVCALAAGQEIDMDQVRAGEDFRWGVRSFHAGFFDDAILSLEKSLSIKPQDLRTRFWLGNAQYRAGFEEAALSEWRYLLERDPGNVALQNTVQVLDYRRGLGEQLETESPLVVAGQIDCSDRDTYPIRRPSSVFARRDGSVYVVAFGSGEIALLDINNQVRTVFRGGWRGYDRPYSCLEAEVPGSGKRYLFISEYGRNRVLKADLEGRQVAEIGGRGSDPGLLLGPQYLTADPRGYLYVSDWGNGRINKYDFDGNFILTIGRRGGSEARLNSPTGIAFQGGKLFVADRGGKRIIVYDDSGNYLYSVGRGFLSGPEGITFRDAETLLVADANRILEYDLKSETWTTLSDMSTIAGHLTQLALSPNRELYAVDFDRSRIYILSEMSSLYTSLFVRVDRVNSLAFPDVNAELTVEDLQGRPVMGLQAENFILSEHLREVGAVQLLYSPSEPPKQKIALVVESSPEMREFGRDLSEGVASLYVQTVGNDVARVSGLEVIGAGETAVVAAEAGATRLEAVEAALHGPWSHGWRFDRGLRLAASRLIPATARKSVVFLTTGRLNERAFGDYSLAEVTDYLQNNSIALYVVSFTAEPDRELEYICAQTGGRVVYYFAPQGIDTVCRDLRERPGFQYVLGYISSSDPGFGRNYLDLQAEAVFHRKSGRTESGYFAPLSD